MKQFARSVMSFCAAAMLLTSAVNQASGAADPLEQWKPAFDPSGAKYTYLLSCVGHPAIEGVTVGFKIRDRVWAETGGRLYVDYRPLGQLGGEKDVINKLKFGAIQGMMSSSVAAANVAPELGIVNLPYVVDTFEKLDAFRDTPATWEPFRSAALSQGIEVVDFTGYGSYGWATTKPVATLGDAAGVNFRIAEAPVNVDSYKAWGLKFAVLPWADVPQALQTGVIDGLDHTPIVCNISKKFTVAKYFTELDYAQGLYVHMVNSKWLKSLPEDVRAILLKVIAEESASARKLTKVQQEKEVAAAKAEGVSFLKLDATDTAKMKAEAEAVYAKWEEKIGKDYLTTVRSTLK